MQLERLPGESDLAYHKRLIHGKLVDKTLMDADYSELAELIYGQQYSSDVARRMMYGSKKTLDILEQESVESVSDSGLISELEQKRIALQKERQKFYDQRNAYNKVIREQARQEELGEILMDAIRSGDLPELQYVRTEIMPSDNDLLVSLSDIHYGADVPNYWHPYNSAICRDMMCRYLDRVLSIAELHGSENCIVWANGDEISGNIHQSIAVSNKENVIEQIKGVSELIAEFIAELSPHFNEVRFVSVAGNHSRLDPNKDRALIGERLDDLVEWYLAARLQNFKNVVIGGGEKIDHTIYLLDVRGKTYCGVHGDFDGSAGRIQDLQTMARRPVYAVLAGHLHHCKTDNVQGVRVVMAGSFLGMDDYCIQKRIYGEAEQMVCVCDENGIRCSYNIPLK